MHSDLQPIRTKNTIYCKKLTQKNAVWFQTPFEAFMDKFDDSTEDYCY